MPDTLSHKQYSPVYTMAGVALISLLTLSLYLQVKDHRFINMDDPVYIYENSKVSQGLNLDNVVWAFTSTYGATWQPLTWLSWMAGVELYGLEPGGHLMTNVVLHLCNAVLLFLLLKAMTSLYWQSLIVACLFAVHPINVEAVAWASARKDVLCLFFGLGSLWWYGRYCLTQRLIHLGTALLLFILGILAKPILVTLPMVLLLLDFWPLRRLDGRLLAGGRRLQSQEQPVGKLLLEKVPFFAVSMASSYAAIIAHKNVSALASLSQNPLPHRLGVALISYANYLSHALLPHSLGPGYGEQQLTVVGLLVSGLVMVVLTGYVVLARARQPYLCTGWFWFCGTLVPMIGIVKFGVQDHADRFMYLPLIGLLVAITWGGSALRLSQKIVLATASGAILGLFLLSWQQVGYWQDSITVFSRTVQVDRSAYVAYENLGNALLEADRLAEAAEALRHGIAISPDRSTPWINLGIISRREGDIGGAIKSYQRALEIDPDNFAAQVNLGVLFKKQGQNEQAVSAYLKALEIKSDQVDNDHFLLYNNLANACQESERFTEAEQYYRQALALAVRYPKLYPDQTPSLIGLGVVYGKTGRFDLASQAFEQVLRNDPDNLQAQKGLAIIRAQRAASQ